MSRYRGNSEACPVCGIKYLNFRTGLDYRTIFDWLRVESLDPADWTYKRRGTILGRWHQEKQTMWKTHLESCEYEARKLAEKGHEVLRCAS